VRSIGRKARRPLAAQGAIVFAYVIVDPHWGPRAPASRRDVVVARLIEGA
jgi:hypothetical protein